MWQLGCMSWFVFMLGVCLCSLHGRLKDRAKVCGHANDLVCVTLTAKDVAAPGVEPRGDQVLYRVQSWRHLETSLHVAEISGPCSLLQDTCRRDRW